MRRGSAGRAWGLGGSGVRSRPTPGDPAELGRQQRARAPHSHARRPPRVPASGGPEPRAEPACGAEGGPRAPPVSFAFAVAGPLRGRGGGASRAVNPTVAPPAACALRGRAGRGSAAAVSRAGTRSGTGWGHGAAERRLLPTRPPPVGFCFSLAAGAPRSHPPRAAAPGLGHSRKPRNGRRLPGPESARGDRPVRGPAAPRPPDAGPAARASRAGDAAAEVALGAQGRGPASALPWVRPRCPSCLALLERGLSRDSPRSSLPSARSTDASWTGTRHIFLQVKNPQQQQQQ